MRESGDAIEAGLLESLRRTLPWVRMCALLGGLVALLMFATAAVFIARSLSGAPDVGGNVAVALPYLAFGAFFILPAIQLWKYAGAVRRLGDSAFPGDLAAVAERQRKLWKVTGIIVILWTGGSLLLIAGIFLFSFFSAAVS